MSASKHVQDSLCALEIVGLLIAQVMWGTGWPRVMVYLGPSMSISASTVSHDQIINNIVLLHDIVIFCNIIRK